MTPRDRWLEVRPTGYGNLKARPRFWLGVLCSESFDGEGGYINGRNQRNYGELLTVLKKRDVEKDERHAQSLQVIRPGFDLSSEAERWRISSTRIT